MSAAEIVMAEKCKDIPDECWELIFNRLPNHIHFEPLSLVCKRFLCLTNRLRLKLSVTDPTIVFHAKVSKLINHRFPDLNSIDFSNFHGNIDVVLLDIANSCSLNKLEEIDVSNVNVIPVRGLKELGSKMDGIRVLKCYSLRVLRDNDLVAIANSLPSLEELDVSYPRTDLDFRGAERNRNSATEMTVTDSGIKVLSMNLKNMRRINVSGNHFITDRSLIYLSTNCAFLEGVDALNCTLITAKGILFLLRNTANLSSVSVSGIDFRGGSLADEDLGGLEQRLHSLVLHDSTLSDEFMHMLGEGCDALKKLSLNCSNFTLYALELLLRRCQSLQHLTLCGLKFLTDESIRDLSPNLHNLVAIKLVCCSKLTNSTFYTLAKSCPSLESVQMDCSKWEGAAVVESRKYANIRSLNLSGSCNLNRGHIKRAVLACPNLEKLDVSYCWRITGKDMAGILSICREIRHLKIAGCYIKSMGEGLELPKLEVLDATCSDINDEGLAAIAIRCPALVKLNLQNCVGVTERGVENVVGNCERLREINLKLCENVDVGVVDWMLSSRPSLVKIVPPIYSSITESQKIFYLHHGCQLCECSRVC